MQGFKKSLLPLSLGTLICMTSASSQAYEYNDSPGKTVVEWTEETLEAVRNERIGTPVAARLYAMLGAAMYDAVNGIDRAQLGWKKGREYALLTTKKSGPKYASREAAAAGAAYAILTSEVPELKAEFKELLQSQISDLGYYKQVRQGLFWGYRVGRAIAKSRSNDGSQTPETLPAGTDIGEFRSDFTSAHFRNMDPFAIENPSIYESSGAPALDSPEYAEAFNEVKALGNGNQPNQEFEEIFRFWRGSGGSARPPGEWMKVAAIVAEQEGTLNSVSDTTRLFALLGMALGDAVIPTWSSKYNFQFWRPGTAVLEANADGNPLTEADLTWVPRNGSLGSSPEHTSGQSTFAGAGSTILKGFFCTDNISFEFEGDTAIAGNRSFDSFSQAAAEAGRARIMAGIHFEFSNQGGQKAGRALASEILDSKLSPLNPKVKDCYK